MGFHPMWCHVVPMVPSHSRGTFLRMAELPAVLGKPFQAGLERYCRIEPPQLGGSQQAVPQISDYLKWSSLTSDLSGLLRRRSTQLHILPHSDSTLCTSSQPHICTSFTFFQSRIHPTSHLPYLLYSERHVHSTSHSPSFHYLAFTCTQP